MCRQLIVRTHEEKLSRSRVSETQKLVFLSSWSHFLLQSLSLSLLRLARPFDFLVTQKLFLLAHSRDLSSPRLVSWATLCVESLSLEQFFRLTAEINRSQWARKTGIWTFHSDRREEFFFSSFGFLVYFGKEPRKTNCNFASFVSLVCSPSRLESWVLPREEKKLSTA